MRMTVTSGEARETGCLYKLISVLIQRYNAVLLHNGLPDDSTADGSTSLLTLGLGSIFTEGQNNNNSFQYFTLGNLVPRG